jgi:predicted nucleic acid-binding protein
MRQVFADTFYWVALINPADTWHSQVMNFGRTSSPLKFFTTDEVLVEVLTFYATTGPFYRRKATALVRRLLDDPDIEVIEQTHQSFLDGLNLYERRMDKGYSLTDCISMNTMRKLRINDVLTHDRHFAQEGFVILFDGIELTGHTDGRSAVLGRTTGKRGLKLKEAISFQTRSPHFPIPSL